MSRRGILGVQNGVEHVASAHRDLGAVQLGQLSLVVGLQEGLHAELLALQIGLHEGLEGGGVLSVLETEDAPLVHVHVGFGGDGDAVILYLGQIIPVVLAPGGGGDVIVADRGAAVTLGQGGRYGIVEGGGGQIGPPVAVVAGYGGGEKQDCAQSADQKTKGGSHGNSFRGGISS